MTEPSQTHYPGRFDNLSDLDKRSPIEFGFRILDDPYTVSRCLSQVTAIGATPDKFHVDRTAGGLLDVVIALPSSLSPAVANRLIAKIKMISGFVSIHFVIQGGCDPRERSDA